MFLRRGSGAPLPAGSDRVTPRKKLINLHINLFFQLILVIITYIRLKLCFPRLSNNTGHTGFMIRRPFHRISSLKQMTMDANLCRIFTQSKLHVRIAVKSAVLPNNKDQPPFTVIPQTIKTFLSSPLHLSHFSLRPLLIFSKRPSPLSFFCSLCLFLFLFPLSVIPLSPSSFLY